MLIISFHRVLGAFNFRQPNIIIRDPETIKQLLIKDFDHFEDHTHVLDEKVKSIKAPSSVIPTINLNLLLGRCLVRQYTFLSPRLKVARYA